MTEESELGPDIIRLVNADSNLAGEIAQRRQYLQSLGFEGACRLFASSGLNIQQSWLQLRGYFDVSYAEFETAFRKADNQ